MDNNTITADISVCKPIKAYHEKKVGKTIYRVTSVYLGEIDLKETLEELTVRKVMDEISCAENAAFVK